MMKPQQTSGETPDEALSSPASQAGTESPKNSSLSAVFTGVKDFWFAKDQGAGLQVDDGNIPIEGLSEAEAKNWFQTLFVPLKPAYKQTLMMAFGINLIGLLASIFALQVYDRVVAKGGHNTLIALATGMALAIVIDFILREGRSALMRRLGSRIEIAMARTLYQRLMHLPTVELEARPPAFWQTTFRDLELVRSVMTGAPALLLIDLPFLVLTLALLSVIAPPLIPLALFIVAVFALLAWRSERVMRGGTEQEKELMINRDAILADLSAARLHLKAIGPSSELDSKWEGQYAKWMGNSIQHSANSDKYRDISQSLMVSSTVIMTSFGAIAILNQLMTMGALIAANILTGKLTGPMVQLVSQWRSFGQFSAARRRLDELFTIPLDRQQTAVTMSRPKGQIVMENVGYSYPGTEILQVAEVSGRLGATGLHVIVGNNGSGKTTLLRLLRGLYKPETGRILIDEADLQQFGQQDLARWIGYLPQQPRLINGSIKENLVLGCQEYTDEQIIHACRLAGAYEMIVALPDGFETGVGEGGSRFSGGQRKRLAIAQCLMQDPPIILLDEPTSDLDSQSEQEFITTLQNLAKTHTVVVVSHSPAILQRCDGIVVMQASKVIAAGKAEEILPKIGFTQKPMAVGS